MLHTISSMLIGQQTISFQGETFTGRAYILPERESCWVVSMRDSMPRVFTWTGADEVVEVQPADAEAVLALWREDERTIQFVRARAQDFAERRCQGDPRAEWLMLVHLFYEGRTTPWAKVVAGVDFYMVRNSGSHEIYLGFSNGQLLILACGFRELKNPFTGKYILDEYGNPETELEQSIIPWQEGHRFYAPLLTIPGLV